MLCRSSFDAFTITRRRISDTDDVQRKGKAKFDWQANERAWKYSQVPVTYVTAKHHPSLQPAESAGPHLQPQARSTQSHLFSSRLPSTRTSLQVALNGPGTARFNQSLACRDMWLPREYAWPWARMGA